MVNSQHSPVTVSLSAFVIKHCRKFRLFPNERTTVLSDVEELQVIQYCLACQNKKEGNDFEADLSCVLKLQDHIHKSKSLAVQQAICLNIQQEVDRTNGSSIFNKDADDRSERLSEKQNKSELKNIDLNELDKDISAETLTSVLRLFQDYKDNSNHWTVLDVYVKFVTVVLDNTSELYQSLSSSEDFPHLVCDLGYFERTETEVLDLIINVRKVNDLDCDANSSKDGESLLNTSMRSSVLNSPQTPVTKSSSRQSPAESKMKKRTPFRSSFLRSPRTPVLRSATGQSPYRSKMETKTPSTPASQLHRQELQMVFIQDIFRSYLHLLVNSRSQLALARVFNIPERGLDHEAFTHLKHEASACGLSMYQTLTSFMLRIHLGGQGYAPSSDNPLMAHVKGLGSLLDLTQKLQTIIEEVPELSTACRRLVNVIKHNLVQSKDGTFLRSLVEPVVEKLHNNLSAIIQEETSIGNSPGRSINRGGSMLGHHCLQVIILYLDESALPKSNFDHQLMSDISFSSQMATRFPCLLTQFRSPANLMAIKEAEVDNKTNVLSPVSYLSNRCFVSSALQVDEDARSHHLLMTQRTLNSVNVIPSKTLVCPRADCTTQTISSNITIGFTRKGGKRQLSSQTDKENMISPVQKCQTKRKMREGSSETIGNSKEGPMLEYSQDKGKAKKPVKSCRRRLLPQVKGQAKITSFFRV